MVYVDGAANQRGSRVRLVLVSLKKITIKKSLRLSFSATNNEAEYEALLVGMAMVQKWVERQWRYSRIQGMWECKNTWVRLGTCNQGLSLSACYISLGVETHMLTLWPLLQPPRHRVYLGSSLLKICTSLLWWGERWSISIKLRWGLTRWTL